MERNSVRVPVLFFNSNPEDKEAFRTLQKSKFPCQYMPSDEDTTPVLLVGHERVIGVEEIKAFVETQTLGKG